MFRMNQLNGFGVRLKTGFVITTYATWNPSDKHADITLSGGNLIATCTTTTVGLVRSTIGKSAGKWYWEYVVGVNIIGPLVGIANSSEVTSNFPGNSANSVGYYGSSGQKWVSGSGSAYGATFATGDVIGVALDMDAGTLVFYKNNVSQGTAATGLSGVQYAAAGQSGANAPTITANFGASALVYAPPTGFAAGLGN